MKMIAIAGLSGAAVLVVSVRLMLMDGGDRNSLEQEDACVPLPNPLEAAVLGGRWEEIERGTAEWMAKAGFPIEATVLRAYAALARGETASMAGHFLRARSGQSGRGKRRCAQDLADRNPDSAVFQLLAADELARSGDFPAALGRLDTALTLDAGLAVARVARGMLRTLAGDAAGALADLETVDPEGSVAAEALVTRSFLRIGEEDLQGAVSDLDAALATEPDHPVALNTRGVARARLGEWESASIDFEVAFRIAPELTEARENWQLARKVQADAGTVIAQTTMERGVITIVTASDRRDLGNSTSFASELIRGESGRTPLVTKDIDLALRMSRSAQPVVLQVHGTGLKSVAGEEMLRTLNTLGREKARVNVVSSGFDAGDNATTGILRHMNSPMPAGRATIQSLKILDPGEVSGLGGKTPLPITDLGGMARKAEEIRGRGVAVVAALPGGKIGVQFLGQEKTFRDRGIETWVTPWKGSLATSVGVSGPSVSLANASDRVSNRDPHPRDWVIYRGGTETRLMGTLVDIANPARRDAAPIKPPALLERPGGVLVGPVCIARGRGGEVKFSNGGDGRLKLVYTFFGAGEGND